MNNQQPAKIRLENAQKTYRSSKGEENLALQQSNLDLYEGEFICFIGPSGCGKSTIINMMAGFEQPTAGKVLIDGKAVKEPNPDHIMMFQDYGLFPWKSALENVLFSLKCRNVPNKEAKERAMASLKNVGLAEHAQRHPHELSGGMRQRVALARALAVEPSVLFMDEPFAALDAFTRMHLQDELVKLRNKRKLTVILVTHDLDEAVYLGDRVVLMAPNPGRIEKVISIDMPFPRNRAGKDFDEHRKNIFIAFDIVHKENIRSSDKVTDVQQDGSGI